MDYIEFLSPTGGVGSWILSEANFSAENPCCWEEDSLPSWRASYTEAMNTFFQDTTRLTTMISSSKGSPIEKYGGWRQRVRRTTSRSTLTTSPFGPEANSLCQGKLQELISKKGELKKSQTSLKKAINKCIKRIREGIYLNQMTWDSCAKKSLHALINQEIRTTAVLAEIKQLLQVGKNAINNKKQSQSTLHQWHVVALQCVGGYLLKGHQPKLSTTLKQPSNSRELGPLKQFWDLIRYTGIEALGLEFPRKHLLTSELERLIQELVNLDHDLLPKMREAIFEQKAWAHLEAGRVGWTKQFRNGLQLSELEAYKALVGDSRYGNKFVPYGKVRSVEGNLFVEYNKKDYQYRSETPLSLQQLHEFYTTILDGSQNDKRDGLSLALFMRCSYGTQESIDQEVQNYMSTLEASQKTVLERRWNRMQKKMQRGEKISYLNTQFEKLKQPFCSIRANRLWVERLLKKMYPSLQLGTRWAVAKRRLDGGMGAFKGEVMLGDNYFVHPDKKNGCVVQGGIQLLIQDNNTETGEIATLVTLLLQVTREVKTNQVTVAITSITWEENIPPVVMAKVKKLVIAPFSRSAFQQTLAQMYGV